MVTAPSEEVAADLARAVLHERLAACVNVIGGVRSMFRWQGEIAEASEVLLLLKTRGDRVDALRSRVVSLHPYEVPEFVVLPIAEGLEAYLGWIRAETAPRDDPEVTG
jgi:periplasmic divalent cation tolerance protein